MTSGNLTTAVSKPTSAETPVYAYNYVNWNQVIAQAESLYNKTDDNVQSRLINGRGWDTALKFIEQEDSDYPTDSTDKGWYANYSSNQNLETGKSIDTTNTTPPNMLKNIYDMGGNMHEWTADQYTPDTYFRAFRGGVGGITGSLYPAAYRGNGDYADSFAGDGFRLALYL